MATNKKPMTREEWANSFQNDTGTKILYVIAYAVLFLGIISALLLITENFVNIDDNSWIVLIYMAVSIYASDYVVRSTIADFLEAHRNTYEKYLAEFEGNQAPPPRSGPPPAGKSMASDQVDEHREREILIQAINGFNNATTPGNPNVGYQLWLQIQQQTDALRQTTDPTEVQKIRDQLRQGWNSYLLEVRKVMELHKTEFDGRIQYMQRIASAPTVPNDGSARTWDHRAKGQYGDLYPSLLAEFGHFQFDVTGWMQSFEQRRDADLEAANLALRQIEENAKKAAREAADKQRLEEQREAEKRARSEQAETTRREAEDAKALALAEKEAEAEQERTRQAEIAAELEVEKERLQQEAALELEKHRAELDRQFQLNEAQRQDAANQSEAEAQRAHEMELAEIERDKELAKLKAAEVTANAATNAAAASAGSLERLMKGLKDGE